MARNTGKKKKKSTGGNNNSGQEMRHPELQISPFCRQI
jgi:hypothetical protein